MPTSFRSSSREAKSLPCQTATSTISNFRRWRPQIPTVKKTTTAITCRRRLQPPPERIPRPSEWESRADSPFQPHSIIHPTSRNRRRPAKRPDPFSCRPAASKKSRQDVRSNWNRPDWSCPAWMPRRVSWKGRAINCARVRWIIAKTASLFPSQSPSPGSSLFHFDAAFDEEDQQVQQMERDVQRAADELGELWQLAKQSTEELARKTAAAKAARTRRYNFRQINPFRVLFDFLIFLSFQTECVLRELQLSLCRRKLEYSTSRRERRKKENGISDGPADNDEPMEEEDDFDDDDPSMSSAEDMALMQILSAEELRIEQLTKELDDLSRNNGKAIADMEVCFWLKHPLHIHFRLILFFVSGGGAAGCDASKESERNGSADWRKASGLRSPAAATGQSEARAGPPLWAAGRSQRLQTARAAQGDSGPSKPSARRSRSTVGRPGTCRTGTSQGLKKKIGKKIHLKNSVPAWLFFSLFSQTPHPPPFDLLLFVFVIFDTWNFQFDKKKKTKFFSSHVNFILFFQTKRKWIDSLSVCNVQ